MPTTTLRTEADIVAAAAALLGFAPTNSIVAYLLHRDPTTGDMVVRAAIRCDITISAEQASNFPATVNLRPQTSHAAVLLAVCDEPQEWHALTVLDALRVALRAAGIPVLRRVITRDVTTEGHWYDPDSGATGPTYPYTDSLVTAHRVLGGDRVSPGRSDIEAEFAYLPPAPPMALADHGELVIQVAQEIADALEGHPINRSLPTRAGIAITADIAVRDAMIAAAAQHSDTAAYVWTHIARRLRGQPAPKRSPSPPRATALWATASAQASPPARHWAKPKPPRPRRRGSLSCFSPRCEGA
ncbi:DUF4192 family protein [Mycobacterium riyadhense]|uniref:DUF4192 family protein n=1 Tax=Mycobacterium riyadhense TaxID=486698 RepID=UPI001EF9E981|nr:DUF4192 family protein [Mycobacterium riyadhense]